MFSVVLTETVSKPFRLKFQLSCCASRFLLPPSLLRQSSLLQLHSTEQITLANSVDGTTVSSLEELGDSLDCKSKSIPDYGLYTHLWNGFPTIKDLGRRMKILQILTSWVSWALRVMLDKLYLVTGVESNPTLLLGSGQLFLLPINEQG